MIEADPSKPLLMKPTNADQYPKPLNGNYNFLFNKHTISLLNVPQFPSWWHGLDSLYLAHIPSYLNYLGHRMVYFKYMLKWINMLDVSQFVPYS